VIAVWGLSEARSFLIPVCIAALLAFTMVPVLKIMLRHSVPEWLAVVISSALLILPFLSIASVLVWEGQALIKDLPSIQETLNHLIQQSIQSEYWQRLHLTGVANVGELMQKFELSTSQGMQFLIAGFGAVWGAGTQLALVLLFAVLMLASRKHLHRSAQRILTQTMGMRDPRLLEEVLVLIEKFLIARMLIVGIVAAVDTAILALAGIQYAFLLGSFLGIMTLIPAIGFILGVVPPILVSLAMNHSFLSTSIMFFGLFAISIIEGNVLTPKMVGGRLNINALTTFIGLFGGGLLWGIWGMILSIPALGILRIALNAAPSLQPWGELLADKSNYGRRRKPSAAEKNQVA
jgi:predicted PurR-regulated permease PerM